MSNDSTAAAPPAVVASMIGELDYTTSLNRSFSRIVGRAVAVWRPTPGPLGRRA